MANKTMKTLTIGDNTYEIVDETARVNVDKKQNTIVGAATTITNSNLAINRALISDNSGKVGVSDVTSTELGYLDGVTSNVQEQLNGKANSEHAHTVFQITDLTATATELNYMDGVTSNVQDQFGKVQTQLNTKASASHTHDASDINELIVNVNELNCLGGITSGVQSQLNNKVEKLTETVSLSTSEWSNNNQTVSVSGVTASNTVIVTPAPASYEHYHECIVRCSSQSSESLTFTCSYVPTSVLTVNVLILN